MSIVSQYSKEELYQIVQQSKSLREVIDKLGYTTHNGNNYITVKNYLSKLEIDTSNFIFVTSTKRTPDNIFIENSTAGQTTLRRYYLKGNYTEYKCAICGQEPFWNGKPLTLTLDHINGKNHDDRLENLRWVCPNCDRQLETTGFKRFQAEKIGKIKKRFYCCDCGIEINRGCSRCFKCSSKNRRKDNRPKRDLLKSLIREKSFTEIGDMYNVSDKAISKWCQQEGLPSKKKDIKKYSDQEWELI